MKAVYFLARTYNDLDCRLPLLLEFARDENYCVTILAIPTNVGIQDPKSHELYDFACRSGMAVTTIFDYVDAGVLLRTMFKIYDWSDKRKSIGSVSKRFQQHLKAVIFSFVRWLSVKDSNFIPGIIKKFDGSIVIVDEIIFHRGRSFFVDTMLMIWMKSHTFQLYAFLTGQDPYVDLWADKAWVDSPVYGGERVGVPLFVPGPNDAQVMRLQLPNEDIVVKGNTRFDKSWIALRADLSRARSDHMTKIADSNPGAIRVVFMLSKIEYGVEVRKLLETINKCAAQHNTVVIVKPHTRSIDLGELRHVIDQRVIDGTDYPSSDLIEWTDYLLFTGSSVAFHAMVRGKQVIYLKYCQRYESIYDASKSMTVARTLEDVLDCFTDPKVSHFPQGDINRFLATHIFNGNECGFVCKKIKTDMESPLNQSE